jgi:hypothetical protein
VLRALRALLAVGLVLVSTVVLVAAPAQAACRSEFAGYGADGGVIYKTVCDGDAGTPGGGSGGSGGGPTCTLIGLGTYCVGASSCWMNVPAAVPPTPAEEAAKPSPTAVWVYRRCNEDLADPLSGYWWEETTGPTLEQLAQQAVGQLAIPAFQLGVNPPHQAVVGIPTWFWAQTGQGGPITGTSALGVVAIGTPSGIEVDPGDGSAPTICDWSTTASATCSYTYARSSAGRPEDAQGRPSYAARARLLYDVRIEMNGAPLDLAGVPDVLRSDWVGAAIPVAEIQALVTRSP